MWHHNSSWHHAWALSEIVIIHAHVSFLQRGSRSVFLGATCDMKVITPGLPPEKEAHVHMASSSTYWESLKVSSIVKAVSFRISLGASQGDRMGSGTTASSSISSSSWCQSCAPGVWLGTCKSPHLAASVHAVKESLWQHDWQCQRMILVWLLFRNSCVWLNKWLKIPLWLKLGILKLHEYYAQRHFPGNSSTSGGTSNSTLKTRKFVFLSQQHPLVFVLILLVSTNEP